MTRKFHIPLLLVFLALSSLPAEPARYDIREFTARKWDIFEGLPSDSIITIYQDSRKYIWIGTFDGLLRYNGHAFVTFDATTTEGFHAHSAHVMVESENGTLWIGTENEGLVRYRNNRFTTFTSEDGLPSNAVRSLAFDSSGRLWIGTNQGLVVYDGVQFTAPLYGDASPVKGRQVNSLVYLHSTGLIATCSDGGIYIHTDTQPDLLPGTEHYRISAFSRGEGKKVWFGTRDGKLLLLDGSVLTECDASGLLGRQIRSLHHKGLSGNLWIATDSGIYISEDMQGSAIHPVTEKSSFLTYVPKTILEDHEGNIWLGTRSGGLYCFTPSPFTGFNDDDGLTDATVNSVTRDDDGRYWIAADDGLYCLKGTSFMENNLTGLLEGVRVKHVMSAGNRLYISTISSMGLVIYEAGETFFLNRDTGLPGNVIKKSLYDSRGNVWISTSNGVIIQLRDGSLKIHNKETGFPSDEIYDLFEDSRGRVWVSAVEEGLFRFDGTDTYTRFSEKEGLSGEMVFSVYEDRDGNFWISTAVGLFIINNRDRIIGIGHKEGLPFLYIYNAVPLDDEVWFTSVRGVSRAKRREILETVRGERERFSSVDFGIGDGLLASPNALSWPCIDPEGKIWIPTHRGLSVLDRSGIQERSDSWPVYIEDIRVDGRTVPDPETPILSKKEIERAEFRFSALTFSRPHHVYYSWYLEGYDEGWSTPSRETSTAYTRLKPGSYIFRVQAHDEEGTVKGRDIYRFTVSPVLYQTLFFRIAVALLVTALLLLAIRFRFRRIRKEKRVLEEEVTRRTGELEAVHQEQLDLLAEISHEIRTPLTIIDYTITNIVSGKFGKHIGRESSLLSSIQRNNSRILVIVENLLHFFKLRHNDSSYSRQPIELPSVLEDYIEEFAPVADSKNITLEMEIQTDGQCIVSTNISLFDSIMLNLISNALTYNSPGGKVTLSVDQPEKGKWRAGIHDTGSGIDEKRLDSIFIPYTQTGRVSGGTGLGLGLVRKAVTRMGGELAVESTPDKGTSFLLTFPAYSGSAPELRSEKNAERRHPAVIYAAAADTRASEAENLPAENTENSGTGESEKPLLLVVEDNRELRNILIHELGPSFTVIPASDGEEALEYLRQKTHPDIIISDIMMPGMGGRELFIQIREKLGLKQVPFLFLTAQASLEEASELLSAGGVDYIAKPFPPRLLLYKARNLVTLQRQTVSDLKKKISRDVLQAIEESDRNGEKERYAPVSPDEARELYSLSKRETEILRLLLDGLRDKEIAFELNCAVSTVSNTLSRIYRKTETSSRIELVKKLSRSSH